MSGKLLDTNAVIALQRRDAGLLSLLQPGIEWFIPAIVLGELYYGAHNSDRAADTISVLEEMERKVSILHVDSITARLYGQVRHMLKIKGRPIPDNDIWIAAITLQHDLTLLTRDQHFKEVEGISQESW